MKALSVRQPWAELIDSGAKSIEIRSWPTSHRGELLIVASARPIGLTWALLDGSVYTLDSGCAICIVRITDCRPMRPDDDESAYCAYEPGLWAWLLEYVCPVSHVPLRGHLGLWECPDDIIERLAWEEEES